MKLVLLDDAGFTVQSWTSLPSVTARAQWEELMFKVVKSIEDYQQTVADKDFDEANRRKR